MPTPSRGAPARLAATLPRWAMLRHIVNHSACQRGQVASS